MSEIPQPDQKKVLKYTQLDTLTNEDIYARGITLVTDKLLPHLGDVPLEDDGMADSPAVEGMGLPRAWVGYEVFYSPEKDTTCNVKLMLLKDVDLDSDSELDQSAAGGLEEISPNMMAGARLKVIARFYRGKHEPDANTYGDGYFTTGNLDPKGELELTLDPSNESTTLQAHLGTSDTQGGIDIGTIDTMALWLRNIEKLY